MESLSSASSCYKPTVSCNLSSCLLQEVRIINKLQCVSNKISPRIATVSAWISTIIILITLFSILKNLWEPFSLFLCHFSTITRFNQTKSTKILRNKFYCWEGHSLHLKGAPPILKIAQTPSKTQRFPIAWSHPCLGHGVVLEGSGYSRWQQ